MRNARLLCLAAVVIAVLAAIGCSGDNPVNNTSAGNVQFVLSASGGTTLASAAGDHAIATLPAGAPALTTHDGDDDDRGDRPALKGFEITIASFLARNLDGQLVDVAMALPVTVDLLALRDTGTVSLPIGSLPPGSYDQIVVVITSVKLTTQNDTTIEITPPGGGWTRIVPVVPFDVVDGAITTIDVRFRADRSLRWVFDHFEFDPDIECDERD